MLTKGDFIMNAEEFAEMFVEDIPNTLKNENKANLIFDSSTLNDDPGLEILRNKVEQAGYKLIPEQDPNKVKFQNWTLTKIN